MTFYEEFGEIRDLTSFKWIKCNNGYHWTNTSPESQRQNKYQTPPFLVSGSTHGMQYDPLEDSVLFTKFASLSNTPDALLNFINQYGLLIGEFFFHSDNEEFSNNIGEDMAAGMLIGDSLSRLQEELFKMKSVFQIWNWYKQGNTAKLSTAIKWKRNQDSDWYLNFYLGDEEDLLTQEDIAFKGFSYNGETGKLSIKGFKPPQSFVWDKHHYYFQDLTPGEISGSAKRIVSQQISVIMNMLNSHIKVSPILICNTKGEIKPYIRPLNLLSAMWYQFYQAVTEKVLRQCSECKKWEDITDKKGVRSTSLKGAISKNLCRQCALRINTQNCRQRKKERKDNG